MHKAARKSDNKIDLEKIGEMPEKLRNLIGQETLDKHKNFFSKFFWKFTDKRTYAETSMGVANNAKPIVFTPFYSGYALFSGKYGQLRMKVIVRDRADINPQFSHNFELEITAVTNQEGLDSGKSIPLQHLASWAGSLGREHGVPLELRRINEPKAKSGSANVYIGSTSAEVGKNPSLNETSNAAHLRITNLRGNNPRTYEFLEHAFNDIFPKSELKPSTRPMSHQDAKLLEEIRYFAERNGDWRGGDDKYEVLDPDFEFESEKKSRGNKANKKREQKREPAFSE